MYRTKLTRWRDNYWRTYGIQQIFRNTLVLNRLASGFPDFLSYHLIVLRLFKKTGGNHLICSYYNHIKAGKIYFCPSVCFIQEAWNDWLRNSGKSFRNTYRATICTWRSFASIITLTLFSSIKIVNRIANR